MRQGATEPYADFVNCLKQSISRQINFNKWLMKMLMLIAQPLYPVYGLKLQTLLNSKLVKMRAQKHTSTSGFNKTLTKLSHLL